jgi:hypothetical protein
MTNSGLKLRGRRLRFSFWSAVNVQTEIYSFFAASHALQRYAWPLPPRAHLHADHGRVRCGQGGLRVAHGVRRERLVINWLEN